MKKIDKILQYIDNQGIDIAKLERESGISNGYFANTQKRGADITDKILEKIRQKQPKVYAEVFGTAQEPQPTTNSTPNDDYQTRYIQLLERVIQDQSDIIKGVLNRIDANLVDAANKQQIFRVMTNANQQVILETLAEQRGLNKYELAQKARSIGAAHLHDIEETYNFDSSDSSDK